MIQKVHVCMNTVGVVNAYGDIDMVQKVHVCMNTVGVANA